MTKPTIICVDDERVVLVSLRDQLIQHLGNDYDIELAESSQEALEIFSELKEEGIEIPLIISDQIMPGMKGDELLIQIHTHYPKTLKILLTGQTSVEAVAKAVNFANLYRYIAKPWDSTDLNLTVTEALRCYAQEQQLAEQNETLKKINTELEQLNTALEQKVAERTAELAQAEAEMRGIFAAITELIFVFDAQGRHLKIASSNPANLYKPADTRIGKTLHEVFEKEQADIFLGYIQQALNTRQSVNVEYSLIIEGKEVWSSASISPIGDDAVIWVARETTDRHLLEEKLHQSEEKIRAIFEAMTDVVLVVDEQGTIEVAPTNPSRLYNADTDLISLTIEQFFLPETSETWFSKVRQAIETQQIVNFDYRLPLADEQLWFSASISPIPDDSAIWVARNISTRKQAEAALQEAKEAAEAANRAKSTFLANMSHELRSPLNAILGFSQLLTRSQSLNPEQQENVSIINRSGEHLLTLINNVLDLSKIEAGRISLNESNFDLYQLLDDLEDMFQVKADAQDLQLIFECNADVPQYIRTDQVKLRQVLINLLNNALKFTQEGAVWVRVGIGNWELGIGNGEENSSTCYSLLFEVEDTGLGIAPEELDSIFEAFVQSQAGIESQEGTGLGLSIARQFVQLMGGEIQITSELGRGTTFKFDIKISTVTATDIEDKEPTRRVAALAPNQQSYRILIVDDKWSNRQLLLRLLNPLGFEIKEASNGKEAIAIWESFEPHLIWMDMRMPVMDGYEATKHIKTHLKGQATAVIALTASILEEEQAVILSAGCDDFVRKPFREAVIFDKMAQYLGVSYVYEELSSPLQEVKTGASLQESLATMPVEWVSKLYQAADFIDNEQIFQLLEQIPSAHTFLRKTLIDWVNSFRCDQIIELIEDTNNKALAQNNRN